MLKSFIFIFFVFSAIFSISTIPTVSAQTVDLPDITPCFMQYRDSVAGLQENWESCHGDDDWLRAVLMPFDWILGGWFLFLIIAVLVLISWLRYHKAIYPVMVGLLFFPAVYWRFPEHLITMGILLAFVAIGISIYYAFMRQTVE